MTSETPPSQDGFSVFREASLPLADAFGLFQGALLILLGLLVYGVEFGGIPFNESGQLGLLLVLTSLQVLAVGSFLGRQYRRSWWLMTIGIVFAGMGIISCIVPGILADVIRPLLGVQNIFTGGLFLALQLVVPAVHGTRSPPAESVTLLPHMKRLGLTVTVLMIVSIAFGLNMLAPVLLPSLVGLVPFALLFPVLVIILGLLMLYIVYIDQKLR
ncbi:MAG TPA: hypothetical protein VEF35_10165 [Candidatus Bathyarchaeia archaeon]|nr:hypothetical protein [Candidatus Bathyarchaeia archaeon]